jgi:hypothetical protein
MEATMETKRLRMLIGLMAVQAAMRDREVKLFRQATLFQRGGEIGLAGAFQLAERGLDSEIFCWIEVEPRPCRVRPATALNGPLLRHHELAELQPVLRPASARRAGE